MTTRVYNCIQLPFLIAVFGVLFFGSVSGAAAAACSSTGSGGNFNSSGSWTSCGGTTPQPADTITINSGAPITVTADATVAGVTVNSSATLTISSGDALTVTGDLSNSGTVTGAGDLVIGGTASSQTIGGFTITGDLIFTKTSGTATMSDDFSVDNLSMIGHGGTLDLGTSNTHTLSGTLTRTFGTLDLGTSTLVADAISDNGGVFDAATASVEYTGTNAVVMGATYSNLTVSGAGTAALSGGTVVSGTLTIESGSALDANGHALTVSGTLDNNGTLDLGDVWENLRPVTIDADEVPGSSSLTDFPMLITGTYDGTGGEPDLRSAAHGGDVQSDYGYDIAFFADDELMTRLSWEQESYVASTGFVAYWVKVPTVSHSSDTTIYMTYGNAGVTTDQSNAMDVWSNGYEAVYHMNSEHRILIDVGGDGSTSNPLGAQTSTPDSNGNYWNNFAGVNVNPTAGNGFQTGKTLSNIVDTENNNRGVTLTITSTINNTFWNNGTTMGLNGDGTTSAVGDYPGSATRDSNFAHNSTTGGQYTFSGLDPTKRYRFKFWGSRMTGGATDSRYIQIKTTSQSWSDAVSYNGANNTTYTQGGYIDNITGVSSVTFDIRVQSGSTFGYIGVIDITASPNFTDSTGSLAMAQNNNATDIDGKIGGGVTFSGSSQYVNLGNNLGITGDVTVQGWINPDNFTAAGGILSKTNGAVANPYDFHLIQTTGIPRWSRGNGTTDSDVDGNSAPTADTWNFIAASVDDDTVTHFLNGSTNGSGSLGTSGTDGSTNAYLATRNGFGTMLDGYMDEIRVSSVARSADWLTAEYNNQNSPSTFYSIGSDTEVSGPTVSVGGDWEQGGTFTAGTSTVKLTNTGSGTITFAGGGSEYNIVWLANGEGGGTYVISGDNTFSELKGDGTAAYEIQFTSGSTQHIADWDISGSSGNLVTITSTDTSTHSLVKDGGNTVQADYLDISHSVATPSSTWFAGSHSVNSQSTASAGSGWYFTVNRVYRGGGSSAESSATPDPQQTGGDTGGGGAGGGEDDNGGSGGESGGGAGGGGDSGWNFDGHYFAGIIPLLAAVIIRRPIRARIGL